MFVNNLDSIAIAESKVLDKEHTSISATAGSAKGIATIIKTETQTHDWQLGYQHDILLPLQDKLLLLSSI